MPSDSPPPIPRPTSPPSTSPAAPRASPPTPARRTILGVRVDDVTWEEALAIIDGFVASRAPHHVVTPNPELVMLARARADFREVMARADLAPADGVGLLWAGRRLGQPLREVVPGSALIERMAARAAPRGDRWFLLGAAPGVAEAVGRILAARHPGLVIAGTHGGSPRPEDEDEIAGRIAAAGPVDALLVAYGSPAQELWIARNQPRLRVPVAAGIGGGFNFIAGRSRRPPGPVVRLNLIWLFRLVTEPWRWRRQAALARFVVLVMWTALRRPPPAAPLPAPPTGPPA